MRSFRWDFVKRIAGRFFIWLFFYFLLGFTGVLYKYMDQFIIGKSDLSGIFYKGDSFLIITVLSAGMIGEVALLEKGNTTVKMIIIAINIAIILSSSHIYASSSTSLSNSLYIGNLRLIFYEMVITMIILGILYSAIVGSKNDE